MGRGRQYTFSSTVNLHPDHSKFLSVHE